MEQRLNVIQSMCARLAGSFFRSLAQTAIDNPAAQSARKPRPGRHCAAKSDRESSDRTTAYVRPPRMNEYFTDIDFNISGSTVPGAAHDTTRMS